MQQSNIHVNKFIHRNTIRNGEVNLLTLPGSDYFRIEYITLLSAKPERALFNEQSTNVFGLTHFVEHLSFKHSLDYSSAELNKSLLKLDLDYDQLLTAEEYFGELQFGDILYDDEINLLDELDLEYDQLLTTEEYFGELQFGDILYDDEINLLDELGLDYDQLLTTEDYFGYDHNEVSDIRGVEIDQEFCQLDDSLILARMKEQYFEQYDENDDGFEPRCTQDDDNQAENDYSDEQCDVVLPYEDDPADRCNEVYEHECNNSDAYEYLNFVAGYQEELNEWNDEYDENY